MKIKEYFFSEKGMSIVNTLFLLSMFWYRSGFIFIAYAAWIVYLILGVKYSESKGKKIVYYIILGIVFVLICFNLYYLIWGW